MAEQSYQYDWFTHNASEWPRLLAPFRGQPGIHFLEVGSFEGRSACWLLQNVLTGAGSRLTCIDLFLDEMGGEDDSMPRMATPNASFDRNIAAIGAGDRVTKLRGSSEHWLRALPPDSFDFIYIDGSHNAPYVLSDAVLAFYLLREGGLICFDDYEWAPDYPPLERPQAGVDAFMAVYAGLFELIDRGNQVMLRKTRHLPFQS